MFWVDPGVAIEALLPVSQNSHRLFWKLAMEHIELLLFQFNELPYRSGVKY
jgi:hypothetical protein